MDMTGVLGKTAECNRKVIFSRKEGTRGMGSRTSPNLPSDEINSQQKAETANQDSHS